MGSHKKHGKTQKEFLCNSLDAGSLIFVPFGVFCG
jgi:hypothetical protein